MQALVYRDGGNLVSGSLDALVQHMVPTAEYYPDRAYLFAFLLSSRLFIKPHELLGEVCALCDSQQKLGDKQVSAKVSAPVRGSGVLKRVVLIVITGVQSNRLIGPLKTESESESES